MLRQLRETLTNTQLWGIVSGVTGLAVIAAALLVLPPGEAATFYDDQIGTLLAPPSQITVLTLGFLCLALAGWQFYRGLSLNLTLGILGSLLVMAFLVAITGGRSLNLPGVFQIALTSATPLALGALSGICCERSGVINIAIEGMMLFGAFVAIPATALSGSYTVGILAAVLTGGLMAALHAVLSIKYKVDQIISGTVINILAAGVTRYLNIRVLEPAELSAVPPIGNWRVPLLADIPVVGKLFDASPTTFVMLVLLVLVNIVLFYTSWGLRTRAVGEHPRAADTVGIHVNRMRYINVIIGGCIAGFAGIYFSLGLGSFEDNMTHGQGFVALAAMVFGKWTPYGSFAAALIFGFADAIQGKMQNVLAVGIPPEFLQMAPYVLTIIILAGAIGRAIPPRAVGKPYEKQ
ncbi:MAG: ABC transporter permease [Chloroflexota bacterium]